LLKKFYEEVNGAGGNLEIVFVSLDRDSAQMLSYLRGAHGAWLAVHYEDSSRESLAQDKYRVEGIPSVIVIDREGNAKVPEARDDLVAYAQSKSTSQDVLGKWKKAVGDWRETPGQSLGGSERPAAPLDADAMRAARLKALESRGL